MAFPTARKHEIARQNTCKRDHSSSSDYFSSTHTHAPFLPCRVCCFCSSNAISTTFTISESTELSNMFGNMGTIIVIRSFEGYNVYFILPQVTRKTCITFTPTQLSHCVWHVRKTRPKWRSGKVCGRTERSILRCVCATLPSTVA